MNSQFTYTIYQIGYRGKDFFHEGSLETLRKDIDNSIFRYKRRVKEVFPKVGEKEIYLILQKDGKLLSMNKFDHFCKMNSRKRSYIEKSA